MPVDRALRVVDEAFVFQQVHAGEHAAQVRPELFGETCCEEILAIRAFVISIGNHRRMTAAEP